jgi:polysaccharide export outer membrane protein
MRYAALILSGFVCAVLAAPAAAAPGTADPAAPPHLRYSVEVPPGDDGTPSAPPSEAPRSAHPRYTAGEGPHAAPVGPVETRALSAPAPRVRAARRSAPVPRERVVMRARSGYTLGPGDKVHVTVYGEADLTGDFEISGSGRLAFPLIGDVRAAGLTAPELGRALTAKLAGGYLKAPRVAVEITTYRPFYIVGQVNKPGRYPYTDGMTAMNAVALAGGFTPRAAESYVYVRHEGQTKETRLSADETAALRPGDTVRVDESDFWSVMRVLQPVTALVGAARYGIP